MRETGRGINRSLRGRGTVIRPAVIYPPRLNSTVYGLGEKSSFGGFNHICIVPGTSGAAEPTIIAPENAPEKVTNGNFDTGITGWAAGNGTPVLTWVANAMRVANGTAYSSGAQSFATTIGSSYLFKAKVVAVVGQAWIAKADDAAYTVNRINILAGVTVPTSGSLVIPATATITYLHVICNASASYNQADDLSAIEVTADGTAAWRTLNAI